ncbi:MAG: CGNR zinc finger domain-containing protein [Terrimesophilobacter sp.]
MPDKSPFPLQGEPLALDLVNTLVSRDGQSVDLLATPEDLDEWMRGEASRLPWPGRSSTHDLASFRFLRDAIAALITAGRTSTEPSRHAIDRVNAALSIGAEQVTWKAGELYRSSPTPRRQALRLVAADAAALLSTGLRQSIRTCDHPGCVLQFLASNPRRRWCTSTGCGNRARVARNYTLHHPARQSLQ